MTDRLEEHLSAAAIGRYASMAYAVSPWMPSSGPASSVDSDTFTGVIPLMIESMPNVNRNAHADAKLTAPHCTRKNRVPPRSNPSTPPDAAPKGSVADEAFEALAGELVRRLQAAPRFDGVLLSLHGAMVVESYPSGDAEIVRRVREVVGPDLPVVVSHDFHANVTPEIVCAVHRARLLSRASPHRHEGARCSRRQDRGRDRARCCEACPGIGQAPHAVQYRVACINSRAAASTRSVSASSRSRAPYRPARHTSRSRPASSRSTRMERRR